MQKVHKQLLNTPPSWLMVKIGYDFITIYEVSVQ